MGRVSISASAPSIVPGAGSCTFSNPDLHEILGIVRTMHRAGAVKWLERVTRKSPRACKYWLSGDFKPKGDDALAIVRELRSEIEAINSRLKQFEFNFG